MILQKLNHNPHRLIASDTVWKTYRRASVKNSFNQPMTESRVKRFVFIFP